MSVARQLAIVFADISDSTGYYDRLGDERASRLIDECLDVMRSEVARSQGQVIKTIGDELMCSFESADDAVTAARGMQRAMNARLFDGERVNLRIGLNYGSVLAKEGDVDGDAVIVAHRMVEQANAGQILTTGETKRVLSRDLSDKTEELYKIPVKGKSAEIRLAIVHWQDDLGDSTLITNTGPMAIALIPKARVQLRCGQQALELGSDRLFATLGRHADMDIRVDRNRVSRQHARIELHQGNFILADWGSANGTYLLTSDGNVHHLRRDKIMLTGQGAISLGRKMTEPDEHCVFYSIEENEE